MNQEIIRAIRKKKRLWKRDKFKLDKTEYKEQEKKTRNLIRNSKRNFEKKLASGSRGNKKPFYSYVRQKTKSRQAVGPLKENGAQVSGNIEMATLLNKCFGEVFMRENLSNIPVVEDLTMDSMLTDVKITVATVRKKINSLRREAAAGPDNIGLVILLELQYELAPLLAHLFRRTLVEGRVPTDWKTANVTPIFKKGSRSDPGNYRPVSLTSVCCKLMESVMRDAITDHLAVNKLISPSQHSFTKNRSCATNILEFLETVTRTLR